VALHEYANSDTQPNDISTLREATPLQL
jgi:hypothetical protein